MTEPGCHSCAFADEEQPPRERVWVGERWRVAHAFDTALPGWLVVVPRRHVLGLHELTDTEAHELGPLLRSASQALVEVTGCAKTYIALFAEAVGFAHLHVHVVPRGHDLPPDRLGPNVFGYLGVPPESAVPVAVRDALATRLGELISV